jgi:N-acyl-D-aspartate/D-glutamate deacylase
MLDLIIRGGQVIDGTGVPRRTADVAVRDGRIVEVGTITAPSHEVVDATGLVVAPGFIDVHTHYDAQVFWDSGLTPTPLHGVTTVISGNCGFTLAPIGPVDADYLIQMLARVEGMPREALEVGPSWDWRTVGDYLRVVEARGVTVNIGFLAGHSTLRRFVMGERCGEPATDEDRAALVAALGAALSDGALGLSTSDNTTHSDESHRPVPSRQADEAELLELAAVLRQWPGTLLQIAPPSGPYSDEIKNRMVALSLAADRPINWNIIVVNSASRPIAENRLETYQRGATLGACVTGLVFPTLNRLRVTFDSGFFIDTIPGWAELFALAVEERRAALADSEMRNRMRAGATKIRPDQGFLSRWGDYQVTDLNFDDDHPLAGRTVAELAREGDADEFDTLLDLVVAHGLGLGFTLPVDGDDEAGWALRGELAADPRVVIGGSDAGAHMDMMCGATYPTAMLAEFPSRGLMGLEQVVQKLTDTPARLFGLRDRGRVEPGYRADLVTFDPLVVRSQRLGARRDLPADAPRVYAASEGIEQVWVNGVCVAQGGVLGDAKPGQVLRSGTDTVTVDNAAGLALTS